MGVVWPQLRIHQGPLGGSGDKSHLSATQTCGGLPTQDSPTNKLLYAKEIPEYRRIVQRYYKQIQDMTPLSEQEMNAHLAEESRVGGLWGRGQEIVTISLALRSGQNQHH